MARVAYDKATSMDPSDLLAILASATNPDGTAFTMPTSGGGVPVSATGTQTSVASSASDVTILAANASRLAAAVYNDSTQVLYLLLGAGVSSTSNYTVQLAAGDYYELPLDYTGVIKGIWAAANGNARVTEWT